MLLRKKVRRALKSGYVELSAVPLQVAYPALRRLARMSPHRLLNKALIGAFGPAFLANRRPHHEFECETVFGCRMAGNTRDLIPALVDLFGILEENLTYWFEDQLQPGDVFVDVGAHFGYFTLFAASRVGSAGGVVAVEASPATYRLLQHNIALNPTLDNIRAVNLAASDTGGTLPVYRSQEETTGLTSLNPRPGASLEAKVASKTLWEILTPDERKRMRIVKIDVEGAEFQVVEGLLAHGLKDTRPDLEIVVETSHDWTYLDRRGSVDDMLTLFRAHGLNAYAMKKETFVDPGTMSRPLRVWKDPGWGYFDLVFSRRDQDTL